MSKVIQFRNHTTNVVDFLKSVIQEVEENHITNMMIACKCEDGSVMTGYTKNLDYGTKQELTSHIQTDIIKQMIEENF